jgi:hypothetical protein
MGVDEDMNNTESVKKLQEAAVLYAKITFIANLVRLYDINEVLVGTVVPVVV